MFLKKLFHGVYNSRGQAVLIVVLVLVVALTVGLSVATRTVTNLRNSQEQSNSQKALAAAEAGIEQAIKNKVSTGTALDLGNNTKYTTTVSAVSGTKFLLDGGNKVSKDDGVFLWLDTPPWSNPWPSGGGSTTVKFYWGDSSTACSNAALEIAVISGDSPATATVKKYAVDPCPTRGNNFTTTTSSAPDKVYTEDNSVSGKTFHYRYSITASKGYLIKIIPIYFEAFVAVDSGAVSLPAQGNIITSTGTSDTSTRTVNVFAGYPEVPTELFPFNLFSP